MLREIEKDGFVVDFIDGLKRGDIWTNSLKFFITDYIPALD